jgi:hypothetical protein
VRGLRNRYRTPGIGAALAASIEPLDTGKQSMRIPPRLKIPVTAFLRLEDPRSALASGKLNGKLEFYTQAPREFSRSKAWRSPSNTKQLPPSH